MTIVAPTTDYNDAWKPRMREVNCISATYIETLNSSCASELRKQISECKQNGWVFTRESHENDWEWRRQHGLGSVHAIRRSRPVTSWLCVCQPWIKLFHALYVCKWPPSSQLRFLKVSGYLCSIFAYSLHLLIESMSVTTVKRLKTIALVCLEILMRLVWFLWKIFIPL